MSLMNSQGHCSRTRLIFMVRISFYFDYFRKIFRKDAVILWKYAGLSKVVHCVQTYTHVRRSFFCCCCTRFAVGMARETYDLTYHGQLQVIW